MRVIARMNAGGPAYHVSVLGGRLNKSRYASLLVHGAVGPGEASFAWLADREGCDVRVAPSLGPKIRPRADLEALGELRQVVRRFRPDIVHTHTAKAGMLGRLAAVLGIRPRPLIVHTYHGHVLEGYFGPVQNRAYRAAERRLGRVSDCLVGVSQATVDDLVRLGVATPDKFRVIPVGLDLHRFAAADDGVGARFRSRVGVEGDEVLLTYVGRLVPIKRVDVVLRALARAREAGAPARLAIVGDGECRPALERLTGELGLSGVVSFVGYIEDAAMAAAAADIAVLSSSNEGTPVSLIEAGAAGVPAVATAVGGVPDVVVDRETGLLVKRDDEDALADAVGRLAQDPELRVRLGTNARRHVLERFSSERLVREIESLYEELLATRSSRGVSE